MRRCEQAPGVSVLEHGRQVADTFETLLAVLRGELALPSGWRLPSWLNESGARETFISRLGCLRSLRAYQLWHDCGKPYCLVLDEQGRRHFPEHAQHSAEVWRSLGGAESIARLMEQDMDAHVLRADEVEEFASRPHAAALWLTALAEVHANAAMFGGWESASFKAKVKHLDRRGKALLGVWRQPQSKSLPA